MIYGCRQSGFLVAVYIFSLSFFRSDSEEENARLLEAAVPPEFILKNSSLEIKDKGNQLIPYTHLKALLKFCNAHVISFFRKI